MYTDTERISQLDTEPNAAMEELVEQYTPLVWHISAKYLFNMEDIKECVNDTFAEVYEHRREFDETKGSLAVWIGTIAKHRAISMYRKMQKDTGHGDIRSDMENLAETDDPIGAAEDVIDIEEAMKKLSETDRQMIRMKYYEGKSIREIAESLHIPYETAKKRHTRSVKNLKKFLIITLAILAALALVACGIIIAYRHFRVVSGYGVTMTEDAVALILDEPVKVQQDMFTFELLYAGIYEDRLWYEYTFSMPEMETHVPEYGEEGYEDPGPYFSGSASICQMDGSFLVGISTMGASSTTFESSQFFKNKGYEVWLKEEELQELRGKETVDFIIRMENISFDGEYYDDIEMTFTLQRFAADEADKYAYWYDDEDGGIILDPMLHGDELTLMVYPMAGEKMEPYIGLTEDRYMQIEEEAPITIYDEAGKEYIGDKPFLMPIGYKQESHAIYKFHRITPGYYTLSLPYTWLLCRGENQSAWINLEDGTFDDKEFTFQGGSMCLKEIKEVAISDEEKETWHIDRKWELRASCDITNDKKKAILMPYEMEPKLRSPENKDTIFGINSWYLKLDEETGDIAWEYWLPTGAEKYCDLSQVEFRLTKDSEYYCVRKDEPVEVLFEVK